MREKEFGVTEEDEGPYQDDIVIQLICHGATKHEYKKLYDQLDEDHQRQVDEGNYQDQIVAQLACGVETMDEDEFDELYDQLDIDHQMQVDNDIEEFADGAVGSSGWRRD